MAIYDILQHPNPRLRQKSTPVDDVKSERIQTIIDNMFDTHYAQENCAALAATQLDIQDPPMITVIDFSPKHDQPLCLVNPEVLEPEGEQTEDEGCMSVGLGANIYEKVTRAAKIRVKALDRDGKPLDFEAEGFMAKCIQHEVDHLHGKLYIDKLSSLKRTRVDKKIEKFNRAQREE